MNTRSLHNYFSPFFVALLIVLLAMSPTWAATNGNDRLKAMEEQVFARTYAGESEDSRLERLETAVFGAPKSGQAASDRISALGQFFNAPQQAATPPSQPPANQGTNKAQPQPRPSIVEYQKQPQYGYMPQPTPAEGGEQQAASPNETRYPAVTAMEQKVFQQAFENEAIERRLNRLENRVMGRPQLGALADRTDQLRMMVLGDVGTGNAAMDPYGNGYSDSQAAYSPNESSYGPGNSNNQSDTQDMLKALPAVEKKVLRNTYPMDSVDARLNRLEMKVFNATAPEMSPEDRLYRVVGVMNAKRSGQMEQANRNGGSYGYGGYGPRGGGSVGGYYGSRSGVYSGTTGSGKQSAGGVMGSMLLMILMGLL